MTWITEGADHGSILGNEQYAAQITAAIREVIELAQMGEQVATYPICRVKGRQT